MKADVVFVVSQAGQGVVAGQALGALFGLRFALTPDTSIPYPCSSQASRELYRLLLAVLQRRHTRQAKRFGHLL